MHIYLWAIIIVVPALLNLIVNLSIFNYASASSRRVQTQSISGELNVGHMQQTGVNRRELHLLRQMIITFCIFIGGRDPIYTLSILNSLFYIHPLIFPTFVVVAPLGLLVGLMNLFINHREVREYLQEKIYHFLRNIT